MKKEHLNGPFGASSVVKGYINLSVFVIPREGNITSYEMEEFVKCEEQDTIHFSPLNASIGMCTNLVGKGTDRDNALQWVEYHRIIGVDHTWIYVDSDWDENKQPDRPYLSWVPYNFDIETFNFTDRPWTEQNELFRVTSQVECLLRARRMGMEWIIFTDIDEYVQVVDNSTIFGDDQHVLKHLLNTYYKDERDKIGGLVMNSIPFGNNLEIEKKPTKTLMIDHVYRNKINPKIAKWIRWKQIVNPQNVHNYATHWLGGGDVLKEVRLDADKVRINHYKEVDIGVGVFQTKSAKNLIEDRSLADTYHNHVMNAIELTE